MAPQKKRDRNRFHPSWIGREATTLGRLGLPAILGLLLISDGCGQEPKRQERERAPKSSPDAGQIQAAAPSAPSRVEDAATVLPERFVGDDIERVYRSLQTTGKSEFETTQAYRKRLSDEAGDALYHFVVEPLEVAYNAAKGQMVLRLWVKVDPSTTDIEEDSALLPVHNKVGRTTFPASNAFGAQVQVQRTKETAYGLAAVKVPAAMIGQRVLSALYDGRYQRFVEIDLPMTPDEARRRKDSLRAGYSLDSGSCS